MTGEPSLEELLSEPIVRLLMASDGVVLEELRRLCLSVGAALRTVAPQGSSDAEA